MRILQNLDTRRMVLGLGLVAFLASASGCTEGTNDVTQNTDAANNPGLAQQKAREAAYGKAGVPQGKQAAPRKAPEK
jgi:hypothetical protein